jgi:glycosyltransferase involved in cell wall biosynthesis
MKFTIVTPAYNGEKYLRQTIESVLSQEGNFDIEYIFADGLSKDGTVEIVKEYISKLESGEIRPKCNAIKMSYFSEKDKGMYDAINKGFAKATGDVLAWINTDDFYLPGALKTISACLAEFPEIDWIKGTTLFIAENGDFQKHGAYSLYNQKWIARGIYGRNAYFINQDNVFWRKSLWNKIGSIPTNLKTAGDYWLWVHFARFSPLITVKKEVSCFRYVVQSLTNRSGKLYRDEQKEICPAVHDFLEYRIKTFFWLTNKMRWADAFWRFIYPLLFRKDQQREYIDFLQDGDGDGGTGKPIKKIARSYVVPSTIEI